MSTKIICLIPLLFTSFTFVYGQNKFTIEDKAYINKRIQDFDKWMDESNFSTLIYRNKISIGDTSIKVFFNAKPKKIKVFINSWNKMSHQLNNPNRNNFFDIEEDSTMGIKISKILVNKLSFMLDISEENISIDVVFPNAPEAFHVYYKSVKSTTYPYEYNIVARGKIRKNNGTKINKNGYQNASNKRPVSYETIDISQISPSFIVKQLDRVQLNLVTLKKSILNYLVGYYKSKGTILYGANTAMVEILKGNNTSSNEIKVKVTNLSNEINQNANRFEYIKIYLNLILEVDKLIIDLGIDSAHGRGIFWGPETREEYITTEESIVKEYEDRIMNNIIEIIQK